MDVTPLKDVYTAAQSAPSGSQFALTLSLRRKKRKTLVVFILIYFMLCLLFSALGCFIYIKAPGVGGLMPELPSGITLRQALKFASLLCAPLVLCLIAAYTPLSYAVSGLCTALCGLVFGTYGFYAALSLMLPATVSDVVRSAALLVCGVLYCLCSALFSAVCAVYRNSGAGRKGLAGQGECCFLYFMYASTAVYALFCAYLLSSYIAGLLI